MFFSNEYTCLYIFLKNGEISIGRLNSKNCDKGETYNKSNVMLKR